MKNVLIVSYFWPPSVKATAHWPFRMAQQLPSRGWTPTILTVDRDTFSHSDPTYSADDSQRRNIVYAPGMEPFDLYRRFTGKPADAALQSSEVISRTDRGLRHSLSIWIRMNLFVPDARIGWYWSATRTAKQAFTGRSFDAVVSVGPPHTGLLVGRRLARMFRIPHVPVLIDPWTDIVYYRDFSRNPITRALDASFERRVLEESAAAIFVTESMREDYVKKYPTIGSRSHVLYWGYDERPFTTAERLPPHDTPTLVHAGNIFDYQNPLGLWRTLRSLNENGRTVRLSFIGTVSPAIRASIREAGLDPLTTYHGFLPYDRMIAELLRATYLMVCASESRHVPGKLFEYLRSGRPILAFGNDNEEVATILQRTGSGVLRRMDDTAENFFSGEPDGLRDQAAIRTYDRVSIAATLASLLDATAT